MQQSWLKPKRHLSYRYQLHHLHRRHRRHRRRRQLHHLHRRHCRHRRRHRCRRRRYHHHHHHHHRHHHRHHAVICLPPLKMDLGRTKLLQQEVKHKRDKSQFLPDVYSCQ